ncbi:MAG TPA: valine--tRNA ligase, partial [Coleofasciculaceae cyanobacterium]
IRNLRAEAEIKPGVKVPLLLQTESETERQILSKGQIYIRDLARVDQLTITSALDDTIVGSQLFAGVTGTIQVLIPLAGIVDITALQARLEKDLKKVEAEIQALSGRLNNPNFVSKARPDVVETTRQSLSEAEKQAEIIRGRLEQL